MKNLRFHIFWLLLFIAPGAAMARSAAQGFSPQFAKGGTVNIKLITNYYPTEGGINGTCGVGGGGKGAMNPCLHLLEDMLEKGDCVVAATQRSGGSAPLWGCKTPVEAVSRHAGKTVVVCFADVYAKKESEGSVGTNGKVQPSKFDLAVKKDSKIGRAIQAASEAGSAGQVDCNGRIPNAQNKERKIDRPQEAMTPPQDPPQQTAGGGGGSPSGGGGSPSGGSAPQQQPPMPTTEYPKPKDPLIVASRTPAKNPKAPAGLDKPVMPKADPPKENSEITKSDDKTPLSPMAAHTFGGDPGDKDKSKPFDSSALGKGGATPATASAGSGSAGSGAGSPSSDSSGASGFVNHEIRGGGGSSASSSGGGSSSSSGSSSSGDYTSPFGNKKAGEPSAGAGGYAENTVQPFDPEGSREPASDDQASGIGLQEADSVFERVHSFFARCHISGKCSNGRKGGN